MDEDEPETSGLVLEEHKRFPSMSSSSADNRKVSVFPTEPDVGSPIFDANHFSIGPKEGDVATFKYVPEIDALGPQEDGLVLEEHKRFPSMSSSSADNRKVSVSPTEPDVGSPIFDANHFSISPKEGDVSTFKYVPEIDALGPRDDDLISSSMHEIEVGTSSKYDSGSFIDGEDTRPELEAFTMGISSDSEGEKRIVSEIILPPMKRASLAEQFSSLCSAPGSCFSTKYGTLSNVYKSLPTGHFDFMETGEALSVPVNDRKQLSASVSSIPYQSGPFGYPRCEAALSSSGKSGRDRPPLTTPLDKFGYKRDIPPLTPPAQKFSYRKLSEKNETGILSGKGSGIRSSGKTHLCPDLTCFRIDEDATEDDVPNDNDALDPRDLSAVLEESALPLLNDSQKLLDDDGPIYQNSLQDITAVLQNTETDAAIHENFPEGGGFAGKKPKQSAASLNKRELGRKASGSMRSGLAMESIKGGQEKCMGMVSSKPSNIVSDVTSFVPLVKQKQQPVASKLSYVTYAHNCLVWSGQYFFLKFDFANKYKSSITVHFSWY
jgi:hypothetical protein